MRIDAGDRSELILSVEKGIVTIKKRGMALNTHNRINTHYGVNSLHSAQAYFSYTQLSAFYMRAFLLGFFLCCITPFAYAEDEEAEGEMTELSTAGVYFSVEPAFVTNYGTIDRLRYVKVEVTLKVAGDAGLGQVNHHMPRIRDEMLSLFGQQTEAEINSIEGKEALRAKSLENINTILIAEDDESHVLEVLFTDFVAHSL